MGSRVISWLIVVMSMAVLASSASLDVDLCAQGEAIWCQSLEAAEVCSAVDHCKETIWKNQKLEKDESNVCLFCEAVVSSSRQMSDAGKSQEEVDAFLLSATDLLPDIDMALKIKKTIDRKSIPKILNSDIAPQMVCRLLDLCQGLHVEMDLHGLESSSEEQTSEVHHWKDVVDIRLTTHCQDCTNFFSALKKLATGPTSALLTDIILDKVCSRTTTYKTQCENVAKNYLRDTIAVLASFLVETKVCQGIRLCKKSGIENVGDSSEVDFGSIDWEKLFAVLAKHSQPGQSDGPQQPTTCTDCNNLFTSIKNLVQNQTPLFITDILLDQVCARLGKYQPQCELAVRTGVTSAIAFAANFINPDQICRATKLCPKSQQSENDLNFISWTKLIPPSESNMLLNQPNSCPDCTKFFTAVKNLVKDSAPGFLSDIMVDQICPLTGTFRKQCEDLTKTYLPVVIGLVSSTLDPDKLCKSIGMCKKSEDEIDHDLIDWSTLIGNQMLLNQPNSCPDCTKFFTAIRNLVKDTAPGFLSDIMVDQICPLTGTFRKQCEDLTKTYLPVAIGLVASTLDPDKLCKSIGMCKKSEDEVDISFIDWGTLIGNQMLFNQPNSCPDCTKFFTAIRNLVKDTAPGFLSDIMVDQICPLTGAFRKQCEDLTKTYLPVAIGLVASTLDPDKLCKSIGMCKKSEDEIDISFIDWSTLIGNQMLLNQPNSCPDCTKFFTAIRNLVKDNASGFLSDIMIDQICPLTGTYRKQCEDLTKTYLPVAIGLIASSLDPDKVCKSIGMCKKESGDENEDSDLFAIDLSLIDWETLIGNLGDSKCESCKKGVQFVQTFIKSDSVKRMIVLLVDKVCIFLGPLRLPCHVLVKTGLPTVLDLLAKLLDPSKVCHIIRLCMASDVFVDDGDMVASDESFPVLEECTACETVIGVVRAAIDTNMTKDDILKSMHGLCALLPSGSAVAVRCNRFVNDYGQQVIVSIGRKLQPKDICRKMELCQAFDFDLLDVAAVMGSEKCIVCRSAVQYLEALMYQSDTVAMIQGQLKTLCHSLPPKVEQDVCLPFVTKYIPQLIYELSILLPPKFFCTKIGICSD